MAPVVEEILNSRSNREAQARHRARPVEEVLLWHGSKTIWIDRQDRFKKAIHDYLEKEKGNQAPYAMIDGMIGRLEAAKEADAKLKAQQKEEARLLQLWKEASLEKKK
jgi:hypothetical protein